jgi:hypothetical protein
VASDGTAISETAFPDPLPALNAQFVDARAPASFDKWGSIVFHNGGPRLLCAKIIKKDCHVEFIVYNADTDAEVGPLSALETMELNQFNIEARPSADCDATTSAKLFLAGPIELEKTENVAPFMVFGNSGGDMFGRAYQPGSYTITAELYSGKGRDRTSVVSGVFEFEIV